MGKIKEFDQEYILLEEMYMDPYFPDFLVDKVKSLIIEFINFLKTGETSRDLIQIELDNMTKKINDLEEEFYNNNSEIETMARDSIADAIIHILSWYRIRIDIEDALRLRNW